MSHILPALLAAVMVAAPTIEPGPQQVAERSLASVLDRMPAAEGGSVVVVDLTTSAVVAMASGPGDRVRAGEALPPGSVLKPFVALALMRAGVAAPGTRVACPARLRLAGANLSNHETIDRPEMDLAEAIARSCNTVFYALASKAWAEDPQIVSQTLGVFGFGRARGVSPDEDSGFVPSPRSEREALSMSIGQASILVTPLQVALAYAALEGSTEPLALDGRRAPAVGANVDPDILSVIREGLRGTVTYGTAAGAFDGTPLSVAGKTGTAQLGARPSAWFAGMFPAEQPRYVVVVALESAGAGASAAAPLARTVMERLAGVRTRGFLDRPTSIVLAILVAGLALRGARAWKLSRRGGP